ncbi:MAG: phosphoglucomutase/phosphomannomutase family protein, partial [Clostridiales bacterium]|nr:phosphoglucomutase/phosphomannomutase family protein [Clostridiales bacterium]
MVRFGTGGWRGIIGQDFIDENIRRVAQALADLVAEGSRPALPVMLGFDRRFLSFDAARWFAEVLCGNGLTVWFMKRT